MQADEPAFSVTAVIGADGTAVVTITGDIDISTLPALAQQLRQVESAQPRQLVFDLASVGFIDCAGAQAIVHSSVLPPGGPKPVLRYPAPAVLRLLDVTGLSERCIIDPGAAR